MGDRVRVQFPVPDIYFGIAFPDERAHVFWRRGLTSSPDLAPFNTPNVKMTLRSRVHPRGKNSGYICDKSTVRGETGPLPLALIPESVGMGGVYEGLGGG